MSSTSPNDSGASQPNVSSPAFAFLGHAVNRNCHRLLTLEQTSEDANADVTAAVEELLNSLSSKFAGVSSEIFAKSELE